MEIDYKKDMRYRQAQKRIKDLKGFYVHFIIYLFVNIAIFVVSTRQTGFMEGLGMWQNYSTLFFWGIGLFAHWASVFGPNFIFGKSWEERKIKEIMDKDKKQLWK